MREAAERVTLRTDERHADGSTRGPVEFLVEALAARAESASEPRQETPESEYPRLVDLLYAEVVSEWAQSAAPPPRAEMLRILTAFQQVRGAMSARSDEAELLWSIQHETELVVELAHDLRSPLTSIIFLTETLRQEQAGAINDLQRRQLGIIYSAALSLVSTASDVIELAQGGARLLERKPSPFSVAELLESTEDILRPVVEEKKLGLHTEGPEMDQRLGHPVALSRVMLNLTANAVRYTETGHVEIRARATGPTAVEFSVQDTGPGLDEEAAKKLFEPLRRNPRNNRFGFSGSGLGLAICRRLVTAMGGDLAYESSPGEGTRFYFELEVPPVRIL